MSPKVPSESGVSKRLEQLQIKSESNFNEDSQLASTTLKSLIGNLLIELGSGTINGV